MGFISEIVAVATKAHEEPASPVVQSMPTAEKIETLKRAAEGPISDKSYMGRYFDQAPTMTRDFEQCVAGTRALKVSPDVAAQTCAMVLTHGR